ncbi:MAG: hypothetical protein F6K50_07385 [Moorea sp. SIO3I7]|nr:hypothetical protein [Moorena sp. SIO3I7]NEO06157.1 hypothetical protein [Moorena sp. SIO3I8]
MQKLRNALLALVIAIALTWMPSFTVASAQAQEVERHPGLQFAVDGWEFVQFQSGNIEPGHEVHVFYDSQRFLQLGCGPVESLKVTGHVMNDGNEFELTELDCLECGEDCDGVVDYVKVGDFDAPEFDYGLEIWFTGTDGFSTCEDRDDYTFGYYW